MGSVELLQDLIHDGVGQIGDHRQLHLPAKRRAPASVCFPCRPGDPRPAVSYSSALLMSSAARSIRALRMVVRGMDTCSEMEEKGGLSRSAAAQDMGQSSRHRDTMESTTTWPPRHNILRVCIPVTCDREVLISIAFLQCTIKLQLTELNHD